MTSPKLLRNANKGISRMFSKLSLRGGIKMETNIRMDKFQVGDKVTWTDEDYATLTGGRERFGDGPFEIIKVYDREFSPPYYELDMSNWAQMGHTQHVQIDACPVEDTTNVEKLWSGSFFRKV
jgi:hypothetical protein